MLITVFGSIICILLTAVISGVGWIAVKVWDVNPKVSYTARRVDRIVDVLPEVKIRIAQEDMQKTVRLALLTGEPTKTQSGDWEANVALVDFATGQGAIFRAPVKGPDDSY